MKKSYLFFLTLIFLLTACGGGAVSMPPTPVGPTPTLRVVMQADDPSTFVLAAGKPQLVEFFAYW